MIDLFHLLWLVMHYARTDGVNDWITHLPHALRPLFVMIAESLRG